MKKEFWIGDSDNKLVAIFKTDNYDKKVKLKINLGIKEIIEKEFEKTAILNETSFKFWLKEIGFVNNEIEKVKYCVGKVDVGCGEILDPKRGFEEFCDDCGLCGRNEYNCKNEVVDENTLFCDDCLTCECGNEKQGDEDECDWLPRKWGGWWVNLKKYFLLCFLLF